MQTTTISATSYVVRSTRTEYDRLSQQQLGFLSL